MRVEEEKMALHNYLRGVGVVTRAFDNNTLLLGLLPVPRISFDAASVLLRTVALYALTHREHIDATVPGPIGPIATPEHLKLFSSYDCLFPFSSNGVSFPAPRNHNDIDKTIANNEFGVVVGAGTTAAHYIAFMNAAAGAGMNQRGNTVANGGTALGEANGVGGPVPVNDENVTALDIHNFYNNYAVARNVHDMNFFDEVNVVHYIHKVVARNNINIIRTIGVNPNPKKIKVNVSNQGLTTTMPIQRSGNFEGAKVESWEAYGGTEAHVTREGNAFINLKAQLSGIPTVTTPRMLADATIFRDLYRLECIREPAALVTNAMFVDLAEVNYTSINNDIYNFTNIRNLMPMAIVGAVNTTRYLWSLLITAHNAIGNHIYYRYDYQSLDGLIVHVDSYTLLSRLENNLLFNYIMHQADQLDTAHVGAGNITDRIIGDVLARPVAGVGNQQAALTDNTSNNPWQLVAGMSAIGVGPALVAPAPIPALVGGLPAGVASIYQVTVPVPQGNITFQARFRNGATLEDTDIFITSFPLALISHLLKEWYRVDIGLPIQDIQIDLQLRT